MKKLSVYITILLAAAALTAMGQVPAKPDPPRLVNDFAGIFTPEQVEFLEDTLVAFSKRTSNQIVVVTLPDLGDLDRAQMATKIGQEWGVGDAEKDNGVVILVKPKTASSKGEVFIAPGIGLEGVLSDGVCSHIIRHEVIPRFKQNDYYGGISQACYVTMGIASGEFAYTPEELNADEDNKTAETIVSIYALLLIFGGGGAIAYNKQRNKERKWRTEWFLFGTGRSAPPPLPDSVVAPHDSDYSSSGGSGSSSSSSSSDYSYGGGSFSGGGAGGSW